MTRCSGEQIDLEENSEEVKKSKRTFGHQRVPHPINASESTGEEERGARGGRENGHPINTSDNGEQENLCIFFMR